MEYSSEMNQLDCVVIYYWLIKLIQGCQDNLSWLVMEAFKTQGIVTCDLLHTNPQNDLISFSVEIQILELGTLDIRVLYHLGDIFDLKQIYIIFFLNNSKKSALSPHTKKVPGSILDQGISVRNLHVLHVPALVLSGNSSFLPWSKSKLGFRLIGNSKLLLGVNVSMYGCLSLYVSHEMNSQLVQGRSSVVHSAC